MVQRHRGEILNMPRARSTPDVRNNIRKPGGSALFANAKLLEAISRGRKPSTIVIFILQTGAFGQELFAAIFEFGEFVRALRPSIPALTFLRSAGKANGLAVSFGRLRHRRMLASHGAAALSLTPGQGRPDPGLITASATFFTDFHAFFLDTNAADVLFNLQPQADLLQTQPYQWHLSGIVCSKVQRVAMTYVQRMIEIGPEQSDHLPQPQPRQPLVLIVEDGGSAVEALQPICDFLEVAIECVPSEHDLTKPLEDHKPMGVVAYMDCRGQDGCHIMMTVAQHDRGLPILLITGDDPVLAGAADAVEELWRLESVIKHAELPGVGAIVDFLFRAGRKGRCMRLLSV